MRSSVGDCKEEGEAWREEHETPDGIMGTMGGQHESSVEDLPAEVWEMVCSRLDWKDLRHLAEASWFLRPHALALVKFYAVSASGLVESPWRMAKTLRQLGNNFGRLRTLDLTAWDNLTAQVLREIPPTVVELDLSMTTITPQGIAALPSHIQSLNLHYTNISSRAITYLNHLTSLRKLNLSRCNGVIAACIQYLPNSIEELDVSFCPNLHFEKKREKTNAETFIQTAFSMSQVWCYVAYMVEWPESLRSLNLSGVRTASAALFGLPPTIRELNMSHISFRFPCFDFCNRLPYLETFIADSSKLNSTSERLRALPEGLKTLSVRDSTAGAALLPFLPTSLTYLDLSYTLVAEYSSLYEMEKINFFFKDIARCAPKLRYIDLRCGYPYGTRKYGPCLRGIVDTVVLDLPLPDDAEDTIPDLAPEERWRPREEHPEWEPYLERCAKSWETVKVVPPEPVPDGDDEDEKEDDGTGENSLGIMLAA